MSERICPCCKTKTKKPIRTHDFSTGKPLDPPGVFIVFHAFKLGDPNMVVAVFDHLDSAREWAKEKEAMREETKERYVVERWDLRL